MQAASNQTASWRNKSTHLQELGHNRRNREGGEPGSINAKGGGRHLKGGSMEPSGRGGGEQTHRDDGKNDTCSAAASSRPRDSEWQQPPAAAPHKCRPTKHRCAPAHRQDEPRLLKGIVQIVGQGGGVRQGQVACRNAGG